LHFEAPLAERGYDVREDVGDLVPHGYENHDHDDRDKNQDQGVLDHPLASLAVVDSEFHLLSWPPSMIDGVRRRLLGGRGCYSLSAAQVCCHAETGEEQ
jgi:hypothetical protein